MKIPSYIGRSADEIRRDNAHFDSAGYLFRAVSWLDVADRESNWPALLYSCIEGRYGIEYLLFEELVIGTGARLSRPDYEKCLRDPTKLSKLIDKLIPDYTKLQQFTAAVISLAPTLPPHIQWSPRELMKDWGKLSEYLHWCGHRLDTAENSEWKGSAIADVRAVLIPIWETITRGHSMCLHPSDMTPEIQRVWEDFKNGKVDVEAAKFRMNLLKPLLTAKYAQQGAAHRLGGRYAPPRG